MKSINISFILISLILSPTAWAQPNPPGSNPDEQFNGNFNPSMGVIIIILVAALFFMGFFSIYIRHCSEDTATRGSVGGRRIGSLRRSRRAPRGLDPEVIESFPTFDYAAVKSEKIGKGALECAVCLTEFEDDDTLRLLPKCDHVFHPDCIDAWLVGHTTCPVCRCNLKDDTTSVIDGETQPPQQQPPLNDIVVEVGDFEDENNSRRMNNNIYNNHDNSPHINDNESDSMEQPLHGRMNRNRTVRNPSFGRPRWLGKLARSFSTGHVSVKQWDNMERFTLRLPAEVRKQIISGKLERTTSLLVLPRESSTRRGFRTGFGGEGSSRGRIGSTRSDRTERSDRWVFSLAPPFFTRAPSVRSPKGMTMPSATTSSRGGSLRGSVRDRDRENVNQEGSIRGNVQTELTQLPI